MSPSRMLLLLSYVFITWSLNVLVWAPTMGYSHVQFMGNIGDILVDDGHNVTMVLVEYDPDVIVNRTTKSNRVIRYVAPKVDPADWRSLDWRGKRVFPLDSFTVSDFKTFLNHQLKVCESLLEDKDFIDLLKRSNFVFQGCPLGIFHIAGIPKLVMASALGLTSTQYMFLDMPIWLSHTPTLGGCFGSKMNIFERIENFLLDVFTKGVMYCIGNIEQSYFEERFPDFPNLFGLGRATVDYAFVNSNEFTETTRTILSSVRHVGGSTIYKPNPLPEDIERIYSKAKKGVVLFSMGSIVKQSDAPLWFQNVFLEAFKDFTDYEFIWKVDSEKTNDGNIHFRSWIPQVSMLADNHFGVPMILIPMFWDQNWHAAAAEEKGYAIKLSKFTLTKEVLVPALETILCTSGNSSCCSYYETAQLASKILKNAPEAMREDIRRVVRLTGENKKQLSHLRIFSDLHLYQLYNFDVYAVLLLVLVAIAVIITRFVSWLSNKVRKTVRKCKND